QSSVARPEPRGNAGKDRVHPRPIEPVARGLARTRVKCPKVRESAPVRKKPPGPPVGGATPDVPSRAGRGLKHLAVQQDPALWRDNRLDSLERLLSGPQNGTWLEETSTDQVLEFHPFGSFGLRIDDFARVTRRNWP